MVMVDDEASFRRLVSYYYGEVSRYLHRFRPQNSGSRPRFFVPPLLMDGKVCLFKIRINLAAWETVS